MTDTYLLIRIYPWRFSFMLRGYKNVHSTGIETKKCVG